MTRDGQTMQLWQKCTGGIPISIWGKSPDALVELAILPLYFRPGDRTDTFTSRVCARVRSAIQLAAFAPGLRARPSLSVSAPAAARGEAAQAWRRSRFAFEGPWGRTAP